MAFLRRRGNNIENDAGRKFLRWVMVVVVLIFFARQWQGLLSFSASLNLSLSDGILLLEAPEVAVPTNITSGTPSSSDNLSEINALRARVVQLEAELGVAKSGIRLASPLTEGHTTSSCAYRSYPVPEHQSGLPYLADVFATRDRQYLFFIGLNRGICSDEFKNQDNWMDRQDRFMCVFPGNIMVISEFVAPTGGIFKNNYMFQCKIPEEFQELVIPGQETTTLHVDLHALHNPEAKTKGMNRVPWFPSQKVIDTPKVEQIPVCHAGYADLDKQYELAAYTRVQSTYRTQVDKEGNTFERSTVHRIEEWIDWHVSQGFDHFIIYDNDATPRGPIETLTKPYVESGLVTYRWFPLGDCKILNGKKAGNIKRFGQAAGGLAAMHRLTDAGAKYLAHMDVDEFFVIYEEGVTVLDFVKTELPLEGKTDVLQFRPTVLNFCHGAVIESEKASPMETKQCWTKSHASDVKLIMRMATIMHFQVHYPLATKSWNKANARKVPWKPSDGKGFLAHYRGEIEPGIKETRVREKVPYFDKFIAERRKKKGLPPLEIKIVVPPKKKKNEEKGAGDEPAGDEGETGEGGQADGEEKEEEGQKDGEVEGDSEGEKAEEGKEEEEQQDSEAEGDSEGEKTEEEEKQKGGEAEGHSEAEEEDADGEGEKEKEQGDSETKEGANTEAHGKTEEEGTADGDAQQEAGGDGD